LARGLAFRLVESMGVIPRSVVAADVKALDQDARGLLRKHGVRFGQYTLFQHLMLKPAATRLRLMLWSLSEGLDIFPEAPPPGLVTIPAMPDAPKGYYPRAGYRLAGDRAIRIDMLERLADLTRACDVKSGFEANGDMLSITGMTLDQFANLMEGLGFASERGEREKVKPAEPQAEVKPDEDTADPQTPEAPEPEVFYTFKWVPKQAGARKPAFKPKGKGKKPQGRKTHSAKPPKKDKPLDPFFKTRSLCAKKVSDGRVRVNGIKISKPATKVSVGDVLTFAQEDWVRVVHIAELGTRRGPAPEAQGLYDDHSDPRPERPVYVPNPKYDGKGRPSRKDHQAQAALRKLEP